MEGRAKRGAFIVFEGIDRAGKSTQCVRLIETLGKSNQVIHMRFPERELASLTGPTIDQYLRGNKAVNDPHAIHLLFSTNRWELTDFLESFLVKGVSVICDRYAHSGAAYSMAKGLDMDWCKAPDRGLIKPDAIFLLDLPVQVAMLRADFGKERFETEAFQLKVKSAYTALRDAETDSQVWVSFDASTNPEALANQVHGVALNVINEAATQPLLRLWEQ